MQKKYPENEFESLDDFLKDSESENAYDSGWKIKKFADKLKDIVCILLGCTRKQLEDREFKNKELSEEWWYWKPKVDITKFSNYLPYLKTKIVDSEKHLFQLTKLTPRKVMQLLGTEAGRNIIHPDLWVNALFSEYKSSFDYVNGIENGKVPKWIITDMRFPNEFNAVRSRDGICVRVNRNNVGRAVTGDLIENMNSNLHLSETALDNVEDWDYVIDNSGSIEDLVEEVKKMLIHFKILEK